MSLLLQSFFMNIGRWWRAVRPFAFPASVMPVVLGTCLAFRDAPETINWFLSVVVLVGVVSLHCFGNLINDYFDSSRNVDQGMYGSRGVLVTGEMTLSGLARMIITFFLIALASGIVLIFLRGRVVLFLGCIGAFLAWAYTGPPFQLKYKGLGDLVIALAFGPLVVFGAYVVQTRTFSWTPVWAAIPLTFLVDAILHSNNTRDLELDQKNTIFTFANFLGVRKAKAFYAFLLLGAYASILILIWTKILPLWSLLTYITIPFAFSLLRLMYKREETQAHVFAFIDARTAQLHLFFSLFLVSSVLL